VRKISPPTGIRSPDRPARNQSLYRLRYPAHIIYRCLNVLASFLTRASRQSTKSNHMSQFYIFQRFLSRRWNCCVLLWIMLLPVLLNPILRTLADLFDEGVMILAGKGTTNCISRPKSSGMSAMCRGDCLATISLRVLIFHTVVWQNDLVVT